MQPTGANQKPFGNQNLMQCRTCSGDHWVSKCPWRDTVRPDYKMSRAINALTDDSKMYNPSVPKSRKKFKVRTNQNVKKCTICTGVHWTSKCPYKDTMLACTSIYITNLSESTNETDLDNLVKPFGPVRKRYLGKKIKTGLCKGFHFFHCLCSL